jgi:hypothetical protein
VSRLRCADVRPAAAEYALAILPTEDRHQVTAHLLHCEACRAEVDAMRSVGERLLDLVPGTEPPLGFDRRVLERVRPSGAGARAGAFARRRPRAVMVGAVAAVAAAVALSLVAVGLGAGARHRPQAVLSAVFWQKGHQVGSVYAYAGHPPWLSMQVAGSSWTGRVTCEVVGPRGQVTVVGSFDLVGGSGEWGAPDPAGVGQVTAVRLVNSRGVVVATTAVGNGAWAKT